MPTVIFQAVDTAARVVVVAAVAYAVVVAATHWAVRRRKLGPFGRFPRLVRRASDPVLLPLERRVIRIGGSPQDAPLWLLGIAIVGGLILLSVVRWLAGTAYRFSALAHAGPRVWIATLVDWAIGLVMLALLVRVIASWFGLSPYSKWMRPVHLLTEWILAPVRRVVPPLGMLDVSPLVAWLILWVARHILAGILL